MRMRKIVEAKERPTLEAAAKEFLAIKQAQMLSDETMHDYQAQLERFVCGSRNSTEYSLLEQDTLAFFAAIPDTSPARYNKPYQYISAFFNWMVRQEYIPKSVNKVAEQMHVFLYVFNADGSCRIASSNSSIAETAARGRRPLASHRPSSPAWIASVIASMVSERKITFTDGGENSAR